MGGWGGDLCVGRSEDKESDQMASISHFVQLLTFIISVLTPSRDLDLNTRINKEMCPSRSEPGGDGGGQSRSRRKSARGGTDMSTSAQFGEQKRLQFVSVVNFPRCTERKHGKAA